MILNILSSVVRFFRTLVRNIRTSRLQNVTDWRKDGDKLSLPLLSRYNLLALAIWETCFVVINITYVIFINNIKITVVTNITIAYAYFSSQRYYVNLRDYLYHNRISVTEFAKTIDYSRGHLTSIINGKLFPSNKLARQIEKATNGEVTADELLKEKT